MAQKIIENDTPLLQVVNPFTMEMKVSEPALSEQNPTLFNRMTFDPEMMKVGELQHILTDILAGDPDALDRPEFKALNLANIKKALDWLAQQDGLSDTAKANLTTEGWRLGFRSKPPTMEEFLTPKYIGPSAETLYPPVRKTLIEAFDPLKPYRTLVLAPHIGYGKEGQNDTPVITPSGTKPIGTMQVGDIICDPDGGTTTVTGVFPQGFRKDLYTITFKDGRKSTVGAGHLWKASKSCNSKRYENGKVFYMTPVRNWRVVDTQEIINDMQSNPKSRWCVPMPKPVFHSEVKHIVDPYLLGVFLGDGHVTDTGVVTIVGNDREVFDGSLKGAAPFDFRFYQHTPEDKRPTAYSLRINIGDGSLRSELYRLGLQGSRSATKFIPKEYLYDSVQNRIALLQGLLDTDGCADKNGRVSFTTSSEQLRDDIIYLVRGLGGFASTKTYTRNRRETIETEHRVFIQFPHREFPLFTVERKQVRIDENFNRKRNRRNTEHLFIKSIEKAPDGEATCIMVDHPEHLFLIDDYTVTHNSLITVIANLYIAVCTSFMIAPYKFFGQSPSTVYTQTFVAATQNKASELLLEPLLNVLESSDFFVRKHTKEAMAKAEAEFNSGGEINNVFWTTATPTSKIQMSNGANFKLISSPNGLLGQSIICGSMTELSFLTDAGWSDEKIFKFFTKLRGRIESRMKGNYYGRFILDSSPNTMESVIDKWIWEDAPKSKNNYIVTGPRWKFFPQDYPKAFDTAGQPIKENWFAIYKGGNGRLPFVVPRGFESEYDTVDLMWAPVDTTAASVSNLELAQENVIEFMRDWGGLPSGCADRIFYDSTIVEKIFNNKLKNIYTHITAPAMADPEHLIWEQVKSFFFYKILDKYHFWYAPEVVRALSVDQSESGDVTCIAVSHVERDPTRLDPTTGGMLPIYITDFTINIIPAGGRINLDAIKFFIIDLIRLGGMNIKYVSFDGYQSSSAIQALKRLEIDVEKQSVDLNNDAYFNFIDLVEKGRYQCGKCIHVKNNLKSLQMQKRNKGKGSVKVEHIVGELVHEGDSTWETSQIGVNAKDSCDAICGSVELLRKYSVPGMKIWNNNEIEERNHEVVTKQKNAMLSKLGLM